MGLNGGEIRRSKLLIFSCFHLTIRIFAIWRLDAFRINLYRIWDLISPAHGTNNFRHVPSYSVTFRQNAPLQINNSGIYEEEKTKGRTSCTYYGTRNERKTVLIHPRSRLYSASYNADSRQLNEAATVAVCKSVSKKDAYIKRCVACHDRQHEHQAQVGVR